MRRKFTTQFKAQVVRELLRDSKTIAQIVSEYEVGATQLSEWKQVVVRGLPRLFEDRQRTLESERAEHDREREELYARIGELTTQLNWLKKIWLRRCHDQNEWPWLSPLQKHFPWLTRRRCWGWIAVASIMSTDRNIGDQPAVPAFEFSTLTSILMALIAATIS
jgi:transposase